MKVEQTDLNRLEEDALFNHLMHKAQGEALIKILEMGKQIPQEKFMIENTKFDLLDKDVAIMIHRLSDKMLEELAEFFNKATNELQKIIDKE